MHKDIETSQDSHQQRYLNLQLLQWLEQPIVQLKILKIWQKCQSVTHTQNIG